MGCINDPPRVSVTVCPQIIMYLVTFIPKHVQKARNYALLVLKWQHTGSKSNLQTKSPFPCVRIRCVSVCVKKWAPTCIL